MTTDIATRAFDPFFTTKAIGSGTGLGLSQVYGMAKQAGGAARIDRSDQRGTTVVLLLSAAEPIHVGSAIAEDETLAAVSGYSILAIDDNPGVRQFLAESLEGLGMEVRLSEDGMNGLAAIREWRPDLLLPDYAMPGLDGAEVAGRVRASIPDLQIVFVTGYSDTAAIETAIGGEALFLKKPFSVQALISVLRQSFRHVQAD